MLISLSVIFAEINWFGEKFLSRFCLLCWIHSLFFLAEFMWHARAVANGGKIKRGSILAVNIASAWWVHSSDVLLVDLFFIGSLITCEDFFKSSIDLHDILAPVWSKKEMVWILLSCASAFLQWWSNQPRGSPFSSASIYTCWQVLIFRSLFCCISMAHEITTEGHM